MKELLARLKIKILKWLILFGVIVAVVVWPAIIFYPMGALLYKNDHPKDGADAIWLLMGGVEVRPQGAAKAHLAKVSDRIIFITPEMNAVEVQGLIPSEQSLTLNILKSYGVDDSKISVISDFGRVSSTAEEAVAMKKFLMSLSQKPARLVVVTSWPHSARAAWTIDKALTDSDIKIEMLPIDAIPYDKSNWWKTERGLLFVFEEYIKWARYLLKYAGRDIS
jgi:uncharacterized SAM-binding protein YcdF (DUF218 family)